MMVTGLHPGRNGLIAGLIFDAAIQMRTQRADVHQGRKPTSVSPTARIEVHHQPSHNSLTSRQPEEVQLTTPLEANYSSSERPSNFHIAAFIKMHWILIIIRIEIVKADKM